MSRLTITDVKAVGNLLTVHFECTGSLKKFFKQNLFFAEYSIPIEDVPESILVIPFLGTVCPIAWANNATVYVDTVDETFLHALEKVKATLQRFYPKVQFRGKMQVKKIAKPEVAANSRSMMLFSGGLDSLTTYVRHQSENPILVSIHGHDVPSNDFESWNTLTEGIKTFSDKTESPLLTIRSNYRSILKNRLLNVCYNRYIPNSWYGRVGHGLTLLSLCAPIAFKEKVGKLYIASSHDRIYSLPWGSHPEIDNYVEWTGTKVVHDGFELTRQDKIKVLADYIKAEGPLYIRSCFQLNRGDNCNRCEKCCRTILGLEMAGIDPNECGYVVDADTFAWIKQNLLYRKWPNDNVMFMWKDIQRHTRLDNMVHKKEAKELVAWLKNVNFDEIGQYNKENIRIRKRLFIKFTKNFPDPLYMFIKKILFKLSYTEWYF
jgi:hypothetical protein